MTSMTFKELQEVITQMSYDYDYDYDCERQTIEMIIRQELGVI